jgi:nitroreductase
MDLTCAIKKRRTIRKFSKKKVDHSTITKLIESAIYAPSACNMQAWKFIIIESSRKMDKMIALGTAKWIKNAPLGILVIYRNDVTINGKLYKDHYQSSAAAIQNILLEATNLGLGACWICDLPRPKYIRAIFNIPKQFDIIAYIALGYPCDDNSNLSLIHYGNKSDFQNHTRKYNISQVINYNSFKKQDSDCTFLPAKKYLLLKHIFLKRKSPFGTFYTDHMLK